jgi:hypothetical protein
MRSGGMDLDELLSENIYPGNRAAFQSVSEFIQGGTVTQAVERLEQQSAFEKPIAQQPDVIEAVKESGV